MRFVGENGWNSLRAVLGSEDHAGICRLGLGGPKAGSMQQPLCLPSPVSSLPRGARYSAQLFSVSGCLAAVLLLVLRFC